MKFKEKFAKFRKSKTFKVVSSFAISAMIASMCCLSCFAADPALDPAADDMTEVKATMSTAFNNVSDDLGDMIKVATPYAVGAAGLTLVVRKGISFFTGLAKKC